MGYRALFMSISIGAVLVLSFWCYEMQIHFGFKIAVFTSALLYLLLPTLFHFCPSVQRHLVFLPWVRWPKGVDFDDPTTEGLHGTINFYLTSEDSDVKIGVWHILPQSLVGGSLGQTKDYWDDALKNDNNPIILYLHGNSGSRAGAHRKELYHILQDLNCHVICADYRGYADSSQVQPTETGVVADAKLVYDYVRHIVGENPPKKIIIWGHSLGTGVSSHLVADLCLEGNRPDALILESPFTNIGEEVKNHMLSAIYRYMPFFDYIFIKPLHTNDIAFKSDQYISKIDIPIAILHAVDDPVIPFFLGQKLFKTALASRSPDTASQVHFKEFGEGHAHKFICRSPILPSLISGFINCTVSNQWPCPGFDNFHEIS